MLFESCLGVGRIQPAQLIQAGQERPTSIAHASIDAAVATMARRRVRLGRCQRTDQLPEGSGDGFDDGHEESCHSGGGGIKSRSRDMAPATATR